MLLSLPHLNLRPAQACNSGRGSVPEGRGLSETMVKVGDLLVRGHLKPQLLYLWSPRIFVPPPPPRWNWRPSVSPGFHRLLPLSSRSENNCFLYGVFNGYDGNRVTNFVAQRLSAELLLGQLNAEHTEADVRRVLLQVRARQLTTAVEPILQEHGPAT